jgi:hypothetical protein
MRNGILLFLTALMWVSCAKDDTSSSTCTGTTPTYTADIAPVFNASCAYAGCHAGSFPSEGLDLSTYAKAKSASLNGKVLASVKHQSGVTAMPIGAPKLSDVLISKIDCWIQNGAPE